jgi:hypothetical protein
VTSKPKRTKKTPTAASPLSSTATPPVARHRIWRLVSSAWGVVRGVASAVFRWIKRHKKLVGSAAVSTFIGAVLFLAFLIWGRVDARLPVTEVRLWGAVRVPTAETSAERLQVESACVGAIRSLTFMDEKEQPTRSLTLTLQSLHFSARSQGEGATCRVVKWVPVVNVDQVKLRLFAGSSEETNCGLKVAYRASNQPEVIEDLKVNQSLVVDFGPQWNCGDLLTPMDRVDGFAGAQVHGDMLWCRERRSAPSTAVSFGDAMSNVQLGMSASSPDCTETVGAKADNAPVLCLAYESRPWPPDTGNTIERLGMLLRCAGRFRSHK